MSDATRVHLRLRRAAWVLALCAALGIAVAWVLRGNVNVVVESTPSGSAVYVDDRFQGRTPVVVKDIGLGPHHLTVTQRDRVEHRGVLQARLLAETFDILKARALRRPLKYHADLKPVATGGLLIRTRPADAEVYLDGRLVGTTPLRLDDVAAGTYNVRLVKKGYETVAARVRVGNETTALDRKLPSVMVKVLEARIKEDPGNLHNYVDLAHLHVVHGDHASALDMLQKAEELIKAGKVVSYEDPNERPPEVRFYSECYKIYRRFYRYPQEGSEALRKAAKAFILAGAERDPTDKRLQNLVRAIEKFDAKN